jgi:hypothetical protein
VLRFDKGAEAGGAAATVVCGMLNLARGAFAWGHTFGRLAEPAASGVPSRFSPAFFCPSSRTGRAVRSWYLYQLSPQLSQRTVPLTPWALGERYHVSEVRVRQSAHALPPALGVTGE